MVTNKETHVSHLSDDGRTERTPLVRSVGLGRGAPRRTPETSVPTRTHAKKSATAALIYMKQRGARPELDAMALAGSMAQARDAGVDVDAFLWRYLLVNDWNPQVPNPVARLMKAMHATRPDRG